MPQVYCVSVYVLWPFGEPQAIVIAETFFAPPPPEPVFPRGSDSIVCLQCGRPRFDPCVRTIPWRRAWQPTLAWWNDKGAWQAIVHGVTKSRTQLSDKQFQFHFSTRTTVPSLRDNMFFTETAHASVYAGPSQMSDDQLPNEDLQWHTVDSEQEVTTWGPWSLRRLFWTARREEWTKFCYLQAIVLVNV